MAGWRENRGLNRPAGVVPIERRASRRWRRTNRSVSAASSAGSDASRSGSPCRRARGIREGDGELERARHAVAQRALGVDGERRLADPRAGSHPGDQPAEQTDQRDRGAERPPRARAARTGRRSRARASATMTAARTIHARRTSRRIHRRRRWGRRLLRSRTSSGSSGPGSVASGSGGTTVGSDGSRRASTDDGASRHCHQTYPSMRRRTASQAPATGRGHELDGEQQERDRQQEPADDVLLPDRAHRRPRTGPGRRDRSRSRSLPPKPPPLPLPRSGAS